MPTKKQKANLKKGGSAGRPKVTPEDKEVKRISKALISDKVYQAQLRAQLRRGTLHPSVQCMLWYYAHGKPLETIETKRVTPVRVTHEYTK